MLNEEKVVLMTKLAAYEQHRGKKDTKIRRYFRGDFLLMQMLLNRLLDLLQVVIAKRWS